MPLFMCDWVENRKGHVTTDNLGYTLVNLSKLVPTTDPFILASQATQVFYVTDQKDKRMSIVFKTPSKNYRQAYQDADDQDEDDDHDDEEFSTVVSPSNDNVLPKVDPLDLGKESRNDYFRKDCPGIVIRPVCYLKILYIHLFCP